MPAGDAYRRRNLGDDLHAAQSMFAADAHSAPKLGDGLHAILSDLLRGLCDPAEQLFPDNAAGGLHHSGQPELSAAGARHAGAAASFRRGGHTADAGEPLLHLPDADESMRRTSDGGGLSADAERRQSMRRHDAAYAERGAPVRRPDRGDGVHTAAGVPSERERDLPDAERGASVRHRGDGVHAAAGMPSECERDLPDAECGASVRRVHAFRPLANASGGA